MRSLSLFAGESLVFALCLSGFESVARFSEFVHGMQGVRSSSLLGSISIKVSSLLAFERSSRAAFLCKTANCHFLCAKVCAICHEPVGLAQADQEWCREAGRDDSRACRCATAYLRLPTALAYISVAVLQPLACGCHGLRCGYNVCTGSKLA